MRRVVVLVCDNTWGEVVERLRATDPNRAGSSRDDGEAKAKKGATVCSQGTKICGDYDKEAALLNGADVGFIEEGVEGRNGSVLCGHGCWKKMCQCQEGAAKETRRDETCCVADNDTVIPHSVLRLGHRNTYCADSPREEQMLSQQIRLPNDVASTSRQ